LRSQLLKSPQAAFRQDACGWKLWRQSTKEGYKYIADRAASARRKYRYHSLKL